ncbi:glutamine--fructose-6-phosphate transaminase (isomerizing) [Guggenheimella bovis]
MCGIIGYIGKDNSVPVLIDGLKKLEYRGYDSAGIAFLSEGKIEVRKALGKLSNLEESIEKEDISGTIGIGHTRWATHGAPSVINAHPHLSMSGRIAVIHNGIIENYSMIKEWLEKEKHVNFVSETDTEVIAHLVDYYFTKGKTLLQAVKEAVNEMEGAYAISVISSENPDEIVAVRKDSPLIIGTSKEGNFLASDVPAIIKYTRDVYYIENDEFVVLTRDGVTIYDSFLQPVKREISHVDWDVRSAEKGGYEHFTLKEIHEQPKGIHDTIKPRLSEELDLKVEFSFTKETLENIDNIFIVACGTAYHAGLVGKYFIEHFADIPVHVEVASEFRYTKQFINEHSLFIAISQSGETIDTLQALRKAKEHGAKILSVLNVVGSSIARESDEVFYTWAGPEIGVASTKAYTTQLASLALIALKMALVLERISKEDYERLAKSLKVLPEAMEEVLTCESDVKRLAYSQFNNERIFFIGRGLDFYSALEASLKLKEVSYINSFAVQAGELKHGTIALVEEGTLAIAFVTEEELSDKMISNIKEVTARGAKVVAITSKGNEELEKVADHVIYIPRTEAPFRPILSIVPMQLFSYYVSLARGNDVDQPRNLAKSVTVE